jgi:hypothetical protein
VGNAFEALLAETDKGEEYYSDSYFTSVESFLAALTVPAPAISTTNTLIDNLTSLSLIYQMTGENHALEPIEQMEDAQTFTVNGISRYDTHCFYGVVIDTGASRFSTAGSDQFQALQRTDSSVQLDKTTKGQVNVQFGIGSMSSIGSAIVRTPIGQVQFHIMPAKTPFLLSLADMDKLGVYFNNLTNYLVTSNRRFIPVV